MNSKKISIITPSFNQAQFLEQTILSVINQNYPNIEYIIIDGGSTDKSIEIVKKYEKHLVYWVSEKDSGQSEAINKGFKKATGEIITWLNSDDQLLPDTLFKVADYFKNTNAALIHGKSIVFGNGKTKLKGANNIGLRQRYLSGMPFPQPSSFFRRSVLLEQGYLDETLHYGMDYDLLVRIALNYEIKKVDDVFSKYRLHKESKSVSENMAFANEWAIVFSKVLRSFDFAKNIIKEMKHLKLYNEKSDRYNISKTFTIEDLQKVFLFFLEYQIHAYYNNLDLQKCKELISFIKNYDYTFYQSQGVKKIFLKSLLLNKPAIRFLRTFTRQ